MVEAMLAQCGPLAAQLIERAIGIARRATGADDLVDQLYHTVLMLPDQLGPAREPPRAADAPLPPVGVPLKDSDATYSVCFYAEQVPLAVAAFVYGQGEPPSIPVCCMLGRDCDSTATTVGAWVGALHGESGLPREWVDPVCTVNKHEIDVRGLATQIADLAARDRA
jgi:hypothetical protein